jgi:hypothetical protein
MLLLRVPSIGTTVCTVPVICAVYLWITNLELSSAHQVRLICKVSTVHILQDYSSDVLSRTWILVNPFLTRESCGQPNIIRHALDRLIYQILQLIITFVPSLLT